MASDVNIGYKRLNDKLSSLTGNGVELSIGSRLFGDNRLNVLNTFTANALQYYGSDLKSMNFKSAPNQSRIYINNWIANATKDKIKNMFPPKTITSATVMVLANAIYFKGTWNKEFNPHNTTKRNFLNNSNQQKQVDMMYDQRNVVAGENTELDCKILQLPYTGNKLSMIFLLPNDANGLSQLESKINMTTFKSLFSGIRPRDTIIRIPKFVFEAKYDLKPVLTSLGITEIFDSQTANFAKMTTMKSVFVNDARHKSYIEVTEQGTEAAAATTIQMVMTSSMSGPFQFVADHPFMFVIRDNNSGTILFVGRYANP
ncbi:leukocyte elastase inhibitor-like [Mytilus californianus]|uniref:leukocyte elastase inhibitor-like n=1 Tax=Mytilus californianus TaxID=6549 RepID=UPI0022463FA1|nr:leukocyte elastase inhibitor-like [Mytilus californianus]